MLLTCLLESSYHPDILLLEIFRSSITYRSSLGFLVWYSRPAKILCIHLSIICSSIHWFNMHSVWIECLECDRKHSTKWNMTISTLSCITFLLFIHIISQSSLSFYYILDSGDTKINKTPTLFWALYIPGKYDDLFLPKYFSTSLFLLHSIFSTWKALSSTFLNI